jgi:hypothetical protein
MFRYVAIALVLCTVPAYAEQPKFRVTAVLQTCGEKLCPIRLTLHSLNKFPVTLKSIVVNGKPKCVPESRARQIEGQEIAPRSHFVVADTFCALTSIKVSTNRGNWSFKSKVPMTGSD